MHLILLMEHIGKPLSSCHMHLVESVMRLRRVQLQRESTATVLASHQTKVKDDLSLTFSRPRQTVTNMTHKGQECSFLYIDIYTCA